MTAQQRKTGKRKHCIGEIYSGGESQLSKHTAFRNTIIPPLTSHHCGHSSSSLSINYRTRTRGTLQATASCKISFWPQNSFSWQKLLKQSAAVPNICMQFCKTSHCRFMTATQHCTRSSLNFNHCSIFKENHHHQCRAISFIELCCKYRSFSLESDLTCK